jgi:hypothetical protein
MHAHHFDGLESFLPSPPVPAEAVGFIVKDSSNLAIRLTEPLLRAINSQLTGNSQRKSFSAIAFGVTWLDLFHTGLGLKSNSAGCLYGNRMFAN